MSISHSYPTDKIDSAVTPLSRWARQVLDQMRWFWRKMGGCFPKQGWIAAKLKVSPETVYRAIRELKQAGLVSVVLHGPRGATYLEVIPEPPSPQLSFNFDGDSDDDRTPVSLCVELDSEVQSEKPSPVPIRKEPLPKRIMGILNRAWGRIKRAKNPAAYREAIIQSELRLMRTNKLLPISGVPVTPVMRRAIQGDPVPAKAEPAIVEFDEEMTAFLSSNCSTLEEFRNKRVA
jgi:hypothetical protein